MQSEIQTMSRKDQQLTDSDYDDEHTNDNCVSGDEQCEIMTL